MVSYGQAHGKEQGKRDTMDEEEEGGDAGPSEWREWW